MRLECEVPSLLTFNFPITGFFQQACITILLWGCFGCRNILFPNVDKSVEICHCKYSSANDAHRVVELIHLILILQYWVVSHSVQSHPTPPTPKIGTKLAFTLEDTEHFLDMPPKEAYEGQVIIGV